MIIEYFTENINTAHFFGRNLFDGKNGLVKYLAKLIESGLFLVFIISEEYNNYSCQHKHKQKEALFWQNLETGIPYLDS